MKKPFSIFAICCAFSLVGCVSQNDLDEEPIVEEETKETIDEVDEPIVDEEENYEITLEELLELANNFELQDYKTMHYTYRQETKVTDPSINVSREEIENFECFLDTKNTGDYYYYSIDGDDDEITRSYEYYPTDDPEYYYYVYKNHKTGDLVKYEEYASYLERRIKGDFDDRIAAIFLYRSNLEAYLSASEDLFATYKDGIISAQLEMDGLLLLKVLGEYNYGATDSVGTASVYCEMNEFGHIVKLNIAADEITYYLNGDVYFILSGQMDVTASYDVEIDKTIKIVD